MTTHKHIHLSVILLLFVCTASMAQNTRQSLLLNLGYYNDNNYMQYLKATAKAKINGKFQVIPGVPVSFYIAQVADENLLGKAVTDVFGEAALPIPAMAATLWNSGPKQTFLAVSTPYAGYESAQTDLDITKAKLKIDTAAGRKIIVTLVQLQDSTWTAVKGADVKVAVKRLGGDLNAGETPTYTTDSLGSVNVDFQREHLPGDASGHLVLIAKVEDNDVCGNLSKEYTVPWGVPSSYKTSFNERTLYARRGKSPVWLEIMGYSIVAAVWIVLFYLMGQIFKIKRMGRQPFNG